MLKPEVRDTETETNKHGVEPGKRSGKLEVLYI